MPGGDTITRAEVRVPALRELLADLLLRAICAQFGHRWHGYARLPYGERQWCLRCETGRIVLEDGETVEATKPQILAGDTRFGTALYEARWGEPPRRPLVTGEWPAA